MPPESESASGASESIQHLPSASSADPAKLPRRWKRQLIVLPGLLLAIGAGAWAYVGSEDALQRFYLPAARRSLDAEIEASGFKFGLPSTIGLKRFAFTHRPTRINIEAQDLKLRMRLDSLWGGRAPRFESLEASSLEITVPTSEADEAPPPPKPQDRGERVVPWIPLQVDQAYVKRVQLRLVEADQTWLSTGLGELHLQGLHPDASTRLSTSFDVRFTPLASGRTFVSEGSFDGHLAQPEAGRALTWEVDLPLTVREIGNPDSASAGLEFSIIQRIEGSLNASGETDVSLVASASRHEEPAGKVTARLEIGVSNESDSARPVRLDAMGDQLQPLLLNPLLAILGPEALAGGSVGGRLVLNLDADTIEIDSEIRGDDLRLAANADHGETPPISIQLAQEAILERDEQRLKIGRSSMSVQDNERLLVEARLTAPFEWIFEDAATSRSLGASGDARSVGTAAQSDENASPARLELSVDRIDIDRLKPWAAVWGGSWLHSASEGTVSADLAAELESSARSITLTGRIEVADLLWNREGDRPSIGPLQIRTKSTARFSDLAFVSVQAFSAEIESSDGPLAQFDARGTVDRNAGAFTGAGSLSIPDIASALDPLDVIPEKTLMELESGSVNLELSLAREGRDQEARWSGKGSIGNATLRTERNRLVRSALAEFEGVIPAGQERAEAIRLMMDITDESATAAGAMTVEGYWPTAFKEADPAASTEGAEETSTSPAAGKLGIRLDGFDLKPWLELFGFRTDDPEGPRWPTSAKLTLTVDAYGDVFTLEGEERIGPLEPASAPPEP